MRVLLHSQHMKANKTCLQFGLATYGRGYTLTDPSCNTGDGKCSWTEGNQPGPCTGEKGVLSGPEIESIIKQKGLTPASIQNGKGNSMMKQITWDDQWVGYDDADTVKEKLNYASARCFGGSMAWSVDLAYGSLTDDGAYPIHDQPTNNPAKGCRWTDTWYVSTLSRLPCTLDILRGVMKVSP